MKARPGERANVVKTEVLTSQASEEEGQQAAPDGQGAGAPDEDQEDEGQYLITIDRRDIHRGLGSLVDDPEFSQAARTIFAGQRTKALKERAEAAERELERIQSTIDHAQFSAWEQDGSLPKRIQDDPKLARRYAEFREGGAERNRSGRELYTAVDGVIDDGVDDGLPESWRQDIHGYVKAGQFGKSAMEILPNVTKYIQRNIARQTWKQAPEGQQEEQASPKRPAGNPRLRQSPDVSNGARGGGKGLDTKSASALSRALARNEITEDEFRKHWANLDS